MLGITFDSLLQWECHIDNLCSKLRSSCYALYFLAQQCSREVLLTLYYANFHSHVRYGIINWGMSTYIQRVFILQKYAVRILGGLRFPESCREEFKNLKILTVAGIYILEVCTFVYKNKNKFLANQVNHNHETRFKRLLQPEIHRTTLYQRNFYYNGCKLYNRLSDNIKSSPNANVFKQRLKKFLWGRSFYTVDEFYL